MISFFKKTPKSKNQKNKKPQKTEEKIQFPLSEKKESNNQIAENTLRLTFRNALFASLLLNVGASYTLLSLFPINKYQLYEVKIKKTDTVSLTINPPLQLSPKAMAEASLMLTKNYVINRHQIVQSNKAMLEKWGDQSEIFYQSTPDVYKNFETHIASELKTIREYGGTQEVIIDSASTIHEWEPREHGFYQIQYHIIGRDENKKIVLKKNYVAKLETTFTSIDNIPFEKRFYNPWGFLVLGYQEND